MASLFVIVPGFGGPHLDEKLRILQGNLDKIGAHPWERLSVVVCCYEDPHAFPQPLPNLRLPYQNVVTGSAEPRASLTWVYEPGIVGQFLKKYAAPGITAPFSHVLVVFDDVELMPNVDFGEMLGHMGFFALDILSPSMTLDSKFQFKYMLAQPDSPHTLAITCACEAFCYLMPRASFERYHAIVDPDANPWLWGIDMCLHRCFGFRVALLNHMNMKHHYKNECYGLRPEADPHAGQEALFRSLGVTSSELSDQKAVLHYVITA